MATDVEGADPRRTDARGLGALLYAALTARWPGADADEHRLEAAPRVGDRLCTPRQVRAAVPAAVNVLCRRALGEAAAGPALDTPDDVAAAAGALLDERARSRWRRSGWFGRGSRAAVGR